MKSTATWACGALAILVTGCTDIPRKPADGTAMYQYLIPLPPVPGTDHPDKRYTSATCELRDCHFTVTVDRNCVITLDPQVMGVKKGNRAVNLKWKLKGPAGYRFADDAQGATPFKAGTPNGIFGRENVTPDMVTRTDENAAPGTYHYSIRVMAPDGSVCLPLDPPVINEM